MKPRSKSKSFVEQPSRATPLVLAITVVLPLLACGPFFPNRLLDGGDDALLAAPEADFAAEIARLRLLPSAWIARPLTNHLSHEEAAATADVEDLRAALIRQGLPLRERVARTKAYERERAGLLFTPGLTPEDKVRATPRIPGNLPGEFADYFRGAIAWKSGDTNAAVAAWRALLERPAADRRFKSTWAAFMLGKAALNTDPAQATNFFRLTRQLAGEGFADSLGLAATSLGWEARVHYDANRLLPALDLYLEQAATGDRSAMVSLRWTAARAFRTPAATLATFARHPRAQPVLTAYLISEGPRRFDSAAQGVAASWLMAVEAAGVKDVASAEQLALAAYQQGDITSTRRWLQLAKETPVAQWLQAKLLLRDGRVDRAAALLARVALLFPLDPAEQREGLARNLSLPDNDLSTKPAANQIWGELGTLQLARRDYAEALEALLRAGFWNDAAYVAERVLDLDELKSFVDRRWSQGPEFESPREDEDLTDAERAYRLRLVQTREGIRHLLARRLMRNERPADAASYFSRVLQARCAAFRKEMSAGEDPSRPAVERAAHLMSAARIARHEGLELMGTELAPDYAIHAGNFEDGVAITNRQPIQPPHPYAAHPQTVTNLVHASEDETRRALDAAPQPDTRYHYRYVGAAIAWSAARLLPDHTDAKARILCEAGSWIKYENPPAADLFYKELVRTCRRTDIGRLADEIRWFPLLDAQGNLRPRQPGPPKARPPSSGEPEPDTVPEPDTLEEALAPDPAA